MGKVAFDSADVAALADKIRERTNSFDTMKLRDMPSKVDEVFNEGKKSEYDTFWDTFQYNGNRTNYSWAFYGNKEGNYCWTPDNFRPKYDLNIRLGRQMFQEWQNNQYTWEYNDGTNNKRIDLTKWFATLDIKFDTSDCTDFTQMFYLATRISRIPPLDIRKAEKLTNMFHQCTVTHTIDDLIVDENTDFSSGGFNNGLPALENIKITGTIGKNFNIQGSSKLTHDSLMSIIDALADKTSDTSKEWVLTIGADNKAKLTENELSEAYTKGWAVN